MGKSHSSFRLRWIKYFMHASLGELILFRRVGKSYPSWNVHISHHRYPSHDHIEVLLIPILSYRTSQAVTWNKNTQRFCALDQFSHNKKRFRTSNLGVVRHAWKSVSRGEVAGVTAFILSKPLHACQPRIFKLYCNVITFFCLVVTEILTVLLLFPSITNYLSFFVLSTS